jgi:hypothetical protein
MISSKTTAVMLTDDEAKKFIAFQKHWLMIGLLESVGAFNVRNGSVTINFDRMGAISSIDKKEHFNASVIVV